MNLSITKNTTQELTSIPMGFFLIDSQAHIVGDASWS